MSLVPRYTPYDGFKRPFSIGLEPLDPTRWIEPDELLLAELQKKDVLITEKRDAVFRERDDTRASQAEVLAALVEHLTSEHAARYARKGDDILIDGAARRVSLTRDAPLLIASRLVQDDLCLMRRDDEAWRLVAASLCFPSSWSLADKFDRDMKEIHAPVPGFAGQMQTRVARIFDNLPPSSPIWRLNWSIYDDDELHHPASQPRRWDANALDPQRIFVRVERQTLRKLPVSGDILFTIRNYLDPIAAFRGNPRRRELAVGLRAQLLALDEAQLRYKNLLADRDALAASLDRLMD